jgi:DnaD/phage-associated family protein
VNDTEPTGLRSSYNRQRSNHFWDQGKGPIYSKILTCGDQLSGPEKLVLLKVMDRAGDGVCFQKQASIAHELGLAERSVRKSLQALIEVGFLGKEPRPDNRLQNQYFVIQEALFEWSSGGQLPARDAGSTGTTIRSNRHEDPVVPARDAGSPTNRRTDNKNLQRQLTAPAREVVGGVDSSEENHVKTIRAWEHATGTLITPQVSDSMADALAAYGVEWVVDAIEETGAQGKTSWKYAEGILRNWKSRGRDRAPAPRTNGRIDPMVKPAAQVTADNIKAADKSFETLLQTFRDAGAPVDLVERYGDAALSLRDEEAAKLLDEIFEVLGWEDPTTGGQA